MDFWYRFSLLTLLLLPFSWLYRLVVMLRRACYRLGLFKTTELPVPVIVVGNITVGGAGKTPTVIALVNALQTLGYQPGVISRGYGAQCGPSPVVVNAESLASEVGDEPLLIAKRTGVPVVVHPDRVAAGLKLLETSACTVIISDDGLQHYALGREVEIAVVDGQRFIGNGAFLPAGPLREPVSRLASVDCIVINGPAIEFVLTTPCYPLRTSISTCYGLTDKTRVQPLTNLLGTEVHAIAGISYPEKFFSALEALGLTVIRHAFPDHHAFTESDFAFLDEKSLVMTEKDAVKCEAFAIDKMWVAPLDAALPDALVQQINSQLATN